MNRFRDRGILYQFASDMRKTVSAGIAEGGGQFQHLYNLFFCISIFFYK
jgi:hypothetical protein